MGQIEKEVQHCCGRAHSIVVLSHHSSGGCGKVVNEVLEMKKNGP